MKKVLFILLLLCSIHFWGFVYLPQKFHYATDSIALLIMGFSFLKMVNKPGLNFRNAIITLFLGLVINIFAAYFNHGQRLIDTFLIFGGYYFILFYFTLHEFQISRKYLENVIIIFALLYALFYLIQVVAYPNPIFTSQLHVDRGTIRLRIEGNGFLVLGYFLLLNRYLIDQKFKNLLLMGLFFLVLLKGGFRTLTFSALFLTVLMFIRLFPYAIKNTVAIFFALILFAALAQHRSTSAIIKKMIYTTQEQKQEGDNYIRYRQFDHFFKRYPENLSYFVFGGGMPAGDSYNSQKMKFYQSQYGFYWVDLGLMGFYIVIGAFATLGILWYTLRGILFKLKPEYIYLNFYFLYLLMVSFTTMEIYRPGVFAVEAITMYMIDIVSREEAMASAGNSDLLPQPHSS